MFLSRICVSPTARLPLPSPITLPPWCIQVDLRDIRVVRKLGGTVEDLQLINGLVFNQKASHSAGGPTRMEKAKIGLIQFCLSAPKADMESSVVVTNYAAMDRIIQEERKYIIGLVKAIQKAGCNVLLIQKSILRDAVNEMSLHFLAKAKIMVVRDVERDEIEFICKTLGCTPVASVDHFTPDKLGSADLADEIKTSEGSVVQVTGVKNPGKTVSILVRGSNKLLLEEAHRALHDSLCVVRSLVKMRYLIAGGGAPEMAVSVALGRMAKSYVEGLGKWTEKRKGGSDMHRLFSVLCCGGTHWFCAREIDGIIFVPICSFACASLACHARCYTVR